jgi:hypothetical protein
MNVISQVSEYRFPSPDLAIVTIRVPVAEIAKRFGLTVENWEEDGLGRARGMFIRFPSGRVMLLRELEHAIKDLGEEGPTVYVDAGEVVACGVEPLVGEVLEGLGLPSNAVARIASNDSRDVAAQMLAKMPDRIR